MPPGRTRVTGRIIDAPFGKGTDGYYRVQWCNRCTHLPVVNLAFMACAYSKDTILEYRGPEITSAEDLLSGSVSGHVAATSAGVAVIHDSLSFLES